MQMLDAKLIHEEAGYTITRGLIGALDWSGLRRGCSRTGWVLRFPDGRERIFETKKGALLCLSQIFAAYGR